MLANYAQLVQFYYAPLACFVDALDKEKDQAWQDAVDAGEQAKIKALENRCTETQAEAWAVKIRDGWFQDWMAEELPGSGPEERKWRTAILAERGIQSKDETPPTG